MRRASSPKPGMPRSRRSVDGHMSRYWPSVVAVVLLLAACAVLYRGRGRHPAECQWDGVDIISCYAADFERGALTFLPVEHEFRYAQTIGDIEPSRYFDFQSRSETPVRRESESDQCSLDDLSNWRQVECADIGAPGMAFACYECHFAKRHHHDEYATVSFFDRGSRAALTRSVNIAPRHIDACIMRGEEHCRHLSGAGAPVRAAH